MQPTSHLELNIGLDGEKKKVCRLSALFEAFFAFKMRSLPEGVSSLSTQYAVVPEKLPCLAKAGITAALLK